VVTLQVFANISGLITLYADGRIFACSDAFVAQLFGLTEAFMQGRPATDFIPELAITEDGLPSEGVYRGGARHRDGKLISVSFQVKRVELEGDEELYCVWIGRETEPATPAPQTPQQVRCQRSLIHFPLRA
jgi:hypothetical protein